MYYHTLRKWILTSMISMKEKDPVAFKGKGRASFWSTALSLLDTIFGDWGDPVTEFSSYVNSLLFKHQTEFYGIYSELKFFFQWMKHTCMHCGVIHMEFFYPFGCSTQKSEHQAWVFFLHWISGFIHYISRLWPLLTLASTCWWKPHHLLSGFFW